MTPRKICRKLSRLAAPVFAALIAAAAVGCGSASIRAHAAPPPPIAIGPVKIHVHVKERRSFQLPTPWAVSYDAGGRHAERSGATGATLTVGPATNLIISDGANPASLLLHRLAELHARLKPGQFPVGADSEDHLHIKSPTYWTSGFWPGALWQAAALQGQPFKAWALQATLRHLGHESTPTHDVGFMYGQSSLEAFNALCLKGRGRVALCSRLKRSVLAAANELMSLAATNRRAGTIPTNPYGPDADTIVDSTMNIAILPWATRVTGNPAYARTAARHARRVAALLVRSDGSTIQAVNFKRRTGRVLSKATHQGLSEHSTWSRGQGWAVYGFAQVAEELHSRALLRVALRAAHYVATHLPASGVPRWDYDAPAGAPVDVSAGVITAAGLLHLSRACHAFSDPCRGYAALGRRMLAGALQYVSPARPLGFLRGQELNHHAPVCWCNGGELIFGLSYALEAVGLAQ